MPVRRSSCLIVAVKSQRHCKTDATSSRSSWDLKLYLTTVPLVIPHLDTESPVKPCDNPVLVGPTPSRCSVLRQLSSRATTGSHDHSDVDNCVHRLARAIALAPFVMLALICPAKCLAWAWTPLKVVSSIPWPKATLQPEGRSLQ